MYLSDHQGDFLHQNNEIVHENKEALHKHALILEVTAQPSCRLLTHKVRCLCDSDTAKAATESNTPLGEASRLPDHTNGSKFNQHHHCFGRSRRNNSEGKALAVWQVHRSRNNRRSLVPAGAEILSEEGSLSLHVNHPAPTSHLSLPAVLLPLINGRDNVGTGLNK